MKINMDSFDPKILYNLGYWSGGYFDVSAEGHLLARPQGQQGPAVDMRALVDDIHEQGLALPVLVRFTDILRHRVDSLCQAFADAMTVVEYDARYTAVYPIKVNQQRRVVETLYQHGSERVGLEAGSKPELLIVLAMARQQGGVIVCNGYKDREYIRLALIGRALGHRIYIVLEKLSELELVIEEAGKLGIVPLLGMRVRLAAIASGNWQNTGGEKGKFGLSAAESLMAIERLQQAGMLDSLRMLHFHMGSQVANIRDVRKAMGECARYYAELRKLGAPVDTVDVGGGLGIDYEGTRSRSYCSMNYSLQEYANTIVHALSDVCLENELPAPNIITESGRALTAHHAVLVTNTVAVEQAPDVPDLQPPADEEPLLLHNLWQVYDNLEQGSLVEAFHELQHWMNEAQGMFSHGVLSLAQRASAEQMYFTALQRLAGLLRGHTRQQREILDAIHDRLADKYFCNFSLFQSLPDAWAIDQVFPVMPLQRLHEPPSRRGVIDDITCDSDGRIDQYVDSEGIESSLPLHPLRPDEPYYLGFFLVGAYQEILGDMHNLFGDTDSVNVTLVGESYRLEQPMKGDGVDAVLRYVQFDAEELRGRLSDKLLAIEITDQQRDLFQEELFAGLQGYTYLED